MAAAARVDDGARGDDGGSGSGGGSSGCCSRDEGSMDRGAQGSLRHRRAESRGGMGMNVEWMA